MLYRASLENIGMSDKLENVTQTISRILDGYDIRLRPNFGGELKLCKFLRILLKIIELKLSMFVIKYTTLYVVLFYFNKTL